MKEKKIDMLYIWESKRKDKNIVDVNGDGFILSRGGDEYMQGNEDVHLVMNEGIDMNVGKHELVRSRLL